MKNNILLIIFLFIFFAEGFTQTNYDIDTIKSNIYWEGFKSSGQKHNGTVKLKEGSFFLNRNNNIIGGKLVIDLNSIQCKDIESNQMAKKFVKHLKSEDFFDVFTHPFAYFDISKLEVLEDQENTIKYLVTGDVSIKGISNTEEFELYTSMNKNELMITGEGSINRNKYNISYGSESLLGELFSLTIENSFSIKLEIYAYPNKTN